MRWKTMVTASALALVASSLGACTSTTSASTTGAAHPLAATGGDTPPPLSLTDYANGATPISPYLIGGNQRWLGNADGVWTQEKPSQRIIQLSKDIGLQSVRYPGGTVANMFDYAKMTGTGPTGCQTSAGFAYPFFSSIPPDQTQYTIAQHARFMAALGGQPRTSLMIPMVNASPSNAVKFVAAMAAATGQKVWNVEIGNEPYLNNQRYWRSSDPTTRLDQYILGGTAQQPAYSDDPAYNGNDMLYPPNTCDFRPSSAEQATGTTYRVRFGPISTADGKRPVIHAGGRTFHWVSSLDGRTGNVFSTNGSLVRFPAGTTVNGQQLRIDYWAGPEPGFVDYYDALKKYAAKHTDLRLNVCSSWGKPEFVTRMKQLDDQTSGAQGKYDCLTVHSYSTPTATTIDQAHQQLNTAAQTLTDTLNSLRTSMRQGSTAAAKRFLLVTEYGVLNPALSGLGGTFAYDLYLAQLMMGQTRNSVHAATLSNFASLFAPVDGTYQLTGRAMVEQLYHRMVGQQPTTVNTTGMDDVWVLGARGSKGEHTLMVVNARSSGDFNRSLRVAGTDEDRCVEQRSLSAPLNASTVPSDDHPTVPQPQLTTHDWHAGSGYDIEAPAHSITLYSITPRTTTSCS